MSDHTTKPPSIVRPGAALKALRLERGWSLAEVSRRSGLPVSSLSKVENDKMELTLDKLMRVSVALDADMAGLFAAPSSQYAGSDTNGRRSITRSDDAKSIDTPIGRYRYLAYELLNKHPFP